MRTADGAAEGAIGPRDPPWDLESDPSAEL